MVRSIFSKFFSGLNAECSVSVHCTIPKMYASTDVTYAFIAIDTFWAPSLVFRTALALCIYVLVNSPLIFCYLSLALVGITHIWNALLPPFLEWILVLILCGQCILPFSLDKSSDSTFVKSELHTAARRPGVLRVQEHASV